MEYGLLIFTNYQCTEVVTAHADSTGYIPTTSFVNAECAIAIGNAIDKDHTTESWQFTSGFPDKLSDSCKLLRNPNRVNTKLQYVAHTEKDRGVFKQKLGSQMTPNYEVGRFCK